MSRGLIAYFSRTGKNYVNGKIMNLSVGNTSVIAGKIKDITGADLFEIQTVKKYPDDYTEATEVSREEQRNNARPEIKGTVKDVTDYEIIYLGYPNWWGTMPMALCTFLESCDLSGKTIAPFCTHEGSGLGRSINDIRRLCPDSIVLKGLAIRGSLVSGADREVEDWLKSNKLI